MSNGTPNMQVAGVTAGRQKTAEEGDLDAIDLDTTNWKTLWSVAGTKARKYWHGSGVPNNKTDVGRMHLDLKTTAPTDVTGLVRHVVYESEDEDFFKAIGPERSLKVLRSKTSEPTTEKTMVPTLNPGANDSEVIGIEVNPSNADGETIDPAGSDFLYQYTEVRT